MKILQVCAFGAPNAGNFISSLLELQKAMLDQGYETVYVFAETAEDKEWCKEIAKTNKVYFLPVAKARILPKTYRIFRKIYRENNISLVHSHFELYDIPATIMASKGTKIFWHLHDPIVLTNGLRKILWKLQYGVVSKRAHLLAVSDYYRDKVVKMGFPKNQTDVILNGIDLKRIKTSTEIAKQEYDFLTFGWDFYRKGDDIIIEACKKLVDEGYSFKVLIIGDENTWLDLDEYLHDLKPNYIVRGNSVENVNELFAVSKVFVQASRRETFSYAVCEAAFAGMPVITSDIAGLEWAHELPSVDFFEKESIDGLYKQMKKFLDGKRLDEEQKKQTQQIIAENYSLDAWAKKVMEFYKIKE